MASLVADYSDSEEDSDCGNEDATCIKQEIKEEVPSNQKVTNFFASAENDSDDDNDDQDNHRDVKPLQIKSEPADVKEKLPNPLSAPEKLPSIDEAATKKVGSFVFVNPFEQAERAKTSILEKHVRLTEAAPKKPAHQPMCWKFKKGKCHLGKNCRFFHDRENIVLSENAASSESDSPAQNNNEQRPVYHPAAYMDAHRRPLEQEPVDDDNYMASAKKKKRFGINDCLVPPKKAFESLQQQRKKERPWTMSNS